MNFRYHCNTIFGIIIIIKQLSRTAYNVNNSSYIYEELHSIHSIPA